LNQTAKRSKDLLVVSADACTNPLHFIGKIFTVKKYGNKADKNQRENCEGDNIHWDFINFKFVCEDTL